MLKGIDVSKWQGTIDWDKVKDQVDFAIIRSSYGTGYTDEFFEKNRQAVRDMGIPHGFYHYAYPNHNTPEAEADWFASVIGKLFDGEILALDFEESYPDPVGWSLRFLNRLSEKFNGYKPLIYLNKYLVQTFNWNIVSKENYGLWLAYWDYKPDAEAPDVNWLVAMRQYTNQALYDGIGGRVDGNVFYGDVEQFAKYGYEGGESSETLPTSIAELEAKIIEVEAELDDMRDSRNYWRTTAKNLQVKYDADTKSLTEQLTTARVQIESLSGTNTVLSEQVKNLKTEVSNITEANKNLTEASVGLQKYKEMYENLKKTNYDKLCAIPYKERLLSLFKCR